MKMREIVMGIEKIKRNFTADTILNLLAKSHQVSDITTLDSFAHFINEMVSPAKIDLSHFKQFFEDLKNAGIGIFESSNQFRWKYPLNAICSQILNPNKRIMFISQEEEEGPMQSQAVKKRGRPKGSKNKSVIQEAMPAKETIKAKMPRTSTKELVFMLRTKSGFIPIESSELEDIAKDLNEMQSKIKDLIK